MGGQYSFFSAKQAIYSSISAGDQKLTTSLLKNNPHLISQPLSKDNGLTPLVLAIFLRNQRMTNLLLGMKANVNGKVNDLTPIMYASYRDSIRIVQLLLQYQADLSICTSQKLDSLDYALLYGNFSISKFLIQHCNMKPRHSVQQYQSIATSKKIYYVNYHSLLLNLRPGFAPQIVPDFFQPIQKVQQQMIKLSRTKSVSSKKAINLSNKKQKRITLPNINTEITQRRVQNQIQIQLFHNQQL